MSAFRDIEIVHFITRFIIVKSTTFYPFKIRHSRLIYGISFARRNTWTRLKETRNQQNPSPASK